METLNGKQLAELIETQPEEYGLFQRECFGHTSIDICRILGDDEWKTAVPKETTKQETPYRSGDIWMDTTYDIIYLYVGKHPDGKNDVVINLGGDTNAAGMAQIGIINSGGDGRIFFDLCVYTPTSKVRNQ